MSVRIVVQARLSSTRLPAKAMLMVGGAPLVALVAQRAANTGIDVVVATSEHADDDVLAQTLESLGITVVRGSLEDPLARFVKATSDLEDQDVVVRYTADNAFPDGALASALGEAVSPANPYARVGGLDRSLPYGLSGEAFTVEILRAAHRSERDPHAREHVTPWIRAHSSDRVVSVADVQPEWAGMRCTIDTFDDYCRIGRVFQSVPDPVNASWRGLVDTLRKFEAPSVTDDRRGPGLVLGTAQLGSDYGVANIRGTLDEEEASQLLYAAKSAGVLSLDTARAYGSSELRIGRALRRGLSEHMQVISKIRPLDGCSDGASAVRASAFESFDALQSHGVDTLLVHRSVDWFRPGVRDALLQLQAEGRVATLGASVSRPDELLSLLEDPAIRHVQIPFNILDRRWSQAGVVQAMAARPDTHIAVRSVFLQGLLTKESDAGWPANIGISHAQLSSGMLAAVSRLRRASAADLAVAYVRGVPWVDSVVVGAETVEQVRDLSRLFRRSALTADEAAQVDALIPAAEATVVDPSRWRFA